MSFRGWKEDSLKSITKKIGSGATPRGGSKAYKIKGTPLIRSQNIYNCEFKEDGIVFLDEEQKKKLDNVDIWLDDVLINITGDSVARCTKVPLKYVGGRVNQHVAILRADKEQLDADYLKYYLVNDVMQKYLLSIARTGGTRAALTKGMLENLRIKMGSLTEQKAIANILSTLDEKIEVNNQINKTLENMAQAIFTQWFVNFEFPNENGEPYKSSGGEMVESELGMIPKGWEVKTIDDIAEITMGQSPKGTSYNEDGSGEVFYQGRTDFDFRFPTRRLYTTEPKRMANENDILMSVRAPVGDINVANENCCIGRGLCAISSKIDLQSYMLYLMLNFKEKLNVYNGEGTVFGSINQKAIKAFKVIVSNECVLEKKFNHIVKKIDKEIKNNEEETRLLTNLRDTLLPKLMSGEIRVPVNN